MAELYNVITQLVNQTPLDCVVLEKDVKSSRLSVTSLRPGNIFEIPISNLSKITLEDIEEGDQLQLFIRPDGSISGFDLQFKPAIATSEGSNLLVFTSDNNAESVPINIVSGFMQSIPPSGNIQVFSRNGKILILKSGSSIFRLRPNVLKNTLYISKKDSHQIHLSQDQNARSCSYSITPNHLKRYNQSWTASDLEIGDRVILKIEGGSEKFRLALDLPRVIEYENRYSIKVGSYPEGFIMKEELGEAMDLFQSGMRNLKALHTHGVVRALLCNRNIMRFSKPYHDAQSIPEPPIQAINQPSNQSISPYQSYQVPSNHPVYPEQFYQVPSNQPISPHQSYQVPSNQSISPYQSYQVPSNYPVYPEQSYQVPSNQPVYPGNISNSDSSSPALTTCNLIMPIDTLVNHFDIEGQKFKDLKTFFSHSRLFINDKFGIYKAVAVGYLDHILRKTSPRQLLHEFISKLESKSGSYSLTLQSEQGRDILIQYLKLLSDSRSYDNLEDHYKNIEFMDSFISELKNLTYNKMIEMNADRGLTQKFKDNHEYEPKDVIKYCGNALGNLLITHSTYKTKGRNIPVGEYSFVINLIVKPQKKVSLLYYRYQIQEDMNLQPQYDSFRCKSCKQLPHITYFPVLTAKTCKRCFSNKPAKPLPNHIKNMPKPSYSLRNNELPLRDDQILYDDPALYPYQNTAGNA